MRQSETNSENGTNLWDDTMDAQYERWLKTHESMYGASENGCCRRTSDDGPEYTVMM